MCPSVVLVSLLLMSQYSPQSAQTLVSTSTVMRPIPMRLQLRELPHVSQCGTRELSSSVSVLASERPDLGVYTNRLRHFTVRLRLAELPHMCPSVVPVCLLAMLQQWPQSTQPLVSPLKYATGHDEA